MTRVDHGYSNPHRTNKKFGIEDVVDKLKGKLNMDYDSDCDVLYAYINKPRAAVGHDLNNGVTLMIDHKRKKIVGFTIVDCKYKIKRGIIKKILHFKDVVPLIIKKISS